MVAMPIPDLLTSGLLQACMALGTGATDVPAPVWVFFDDNRAMPASIADTALAPRALERRALRLNAVSGTSLSTPLVAAAAACILQARPDYGVAQVRQALFATASRSDAQGLHPDPNFVKGHGLLRAYNAAMFGKNFADLNMDGAVNGADLGIMLGEWGRTGNIGEVWGDLNSDGVVNGGDLGRLLGQWG